MGNQSKVKMMDFILNHPIRKKAEPTTSELNEFVSLLTQYVSFMNPFD